MSIKVFTWDCEKKWECIILFSTCMYVILYMYVYVCVCVCVLGLNNLEIYLIIFTDIALAMWYAILEGKITFTSLFSSWLIEKHSNDYGVIIAEICTKQRCFLKPVEYIWYIYMMCRPGCLRSTTIFNLKWYMDTQNCSRSCCDFDKNLINCSALICVYVCICMYVCVCARVHKASNLLSSMSVCREVRDISCSNF